LKLQSAPSRVYLDLESAAGPAKLSDPQRYLADPENTLVILDDVHRVPDLFQSLRGLIERGRRKGKRVGGLLVLESASLDLLRPVKCW
jgi:hypothetical protein